MSRKATSEKAQASKEDRVAFSISFSRAFALVASVHKEKSLRSRRPLTRSSASSAVRWGISARTALIRSRQLLLSMVD